MVLRFRDGNPFHSHKIAIPLKAANRARRRAWRTKAAHQPAAATVGAGADAKDHVRRTPNHEPEACGACPRPQRSSCRSAPERSRWVRRRRAWRGPDRAWPGHLHSRRAEPPSSAECEVADVRAAWAIEPWTIVSILPSSIATHGDVSAIGARNPATSARARTRGRQRNPQVRESSSPAHRVGDRTAHDRFDGASNDRRLTRGPIGFHVTIRLEDDRPIAVTQAALRVIARVVLEQGEERGLLAFGAADDHLHAALATDRASAGAFARYVESALVWRLGLAARFERARIRPLQDQKHAYNTFHSPIGRTRGTGSISIAPAKQRASPTSSDCGSWRHPSSLASARICRGSAARIFSGSFHRGPSTSKHRSISTF